MHSSQEQSNRKKSTQITRSDTIPIFALCCAINWPENMHTKSVVSFRWNCGPPPALKSGDQTKMLIDSSHLRRKKKGFKAIIHNWHSQYKYAEQLRDGCETNGGETREGTRENNKLTVGNVHLLAGRHLNAVTNWIQLRSVRAIHNNEMKKRNYLQKNSNITFDASTW